MRIERFNTINIRYHARDGIAAAQALQSGRRLWFQGAIELIAQLGEQVKCNIVPGVLFDIPDGAFEQRQHHQRDHNRFQRERFSESCTRYP